MGHGLDSQRDPAGMQLWLQICWKGPIKKGRLHRERTGTWGTLHAPGQRQQLPDALALKCFQRLL